MGEIMIHAGASKDDTLLTHDTGGDVMTLGDRVTVRTFVATRPAALGPSAARRFSLQI